MKLKAFGLAPELRDWGLKYIETLRDQEIDNKSQIIVQRKKAYEQCVIRLENLVKLKTAPENADNSLLSDEEYQKQRADLLAQKSTLGSDTGTFEMEVKGRVRLAKEALTVVANIEELPPDQGALRKREILSALGLNHVLKEKELEIKPQFPFSELPHGGKRDQCNLNPIEPENMQAGKALNGSFDSACPSLERDVDEDRTKPLKLALERIWKQTDPWSQLIKRKSFKQGTPPRRDTRGRFIAPKYFEDL